MRILWKSFTPPQQFSQIDIFAEDAILTNCRKDFSSEADLLCFYLSESPVAGLACCSPTKLARGPTDHWCRGLLRGPRACQGIEHTSHLAPGPLVMVHISRNGGPESGILILGDFGDSWGLRACQGTGHTSVRAIGATSGAWGS